MSPALRRRRSANLLHVQIEVIEAITPPHEGIGPCHITGVVARVFNGDLALGQQISFSLPCIGDAPDWRKEADGGPSVFVAGYLRAAKVMEIFLEHRDGGFWSPEDEVLVLPALTDEPVFGADC